jgi:WD40 repeat protein
MSAGHVSQHRHAALARRATGGVGIAGLLLGTVVAAASLVPAGAAGRTAGDAQPFGPPMHAALSAAHGNPREALELTAKGETSGSAGDLDGYSVSISGDYAVVGAPGVSGSAGAAYIYRWSGVDWTQQTALPDPRGLADDGYGWSVAVFSTTTANYVAIGGDEQNGDPDVIYVYKGSGATWSKQASLYDPNGTTTDMFGAAMTISGSVLVVGAPGVTGKSGAVYIYDRSGTTWNQEAAKTDPGETSDDMFGRAVSISGEKVIVGAVNIAYIYTGAGGNWTQTKVFSNPGSAKDNFGYATTLDGSTAVIGAPGGVPGSPIGSPKSAGAAYSYTLKGSTWSAAKKVVAPTGTQGDEFGYAVTDTDNGLLVGMPIYGAVNCGTTFGYTPSGSTWNFEEQVQNPDCTAGDEFGFSTSLSGTTGIVGAPGTDSDAGSVSFVSLVPTSPKNILHDPGGSGVYAVAFTPDSGTIATGDLNGSAYLWSSGVNSPTATLPSPNGEGIYGDAFSPDGSTLAVGTSNKQYSKGSVYLWNVSSDTLTNTFVDPEGGGNGPVAFSPSGTTLAAGDNEGKTYLWNPTSGALMATLSDPASGGVSGVAFTEDSSFLATSSLNGDDYVWDMSNDTLASTTTDPDSQGINDVAFAPDEDTATADSNGHVYIWEAPGTLVETLSDPTNQPVYGVAFSPSGAFLAASTTNAADTESDIYVWNVDTGSLVATLQDANTEGAFHLTFSGTGNTLAVADADDDTYLWDMTWLTP